jgi:pathogenesis-related protein 1
MYKKVSLTIIMASAIAAILIVPWSALQRSYAQSDIAKTILEIHNSERAAVGVPDLVWSDKLAADAKPWAEYLATTGKFEHDTNRGNVGENIAGFNPSKGVSAPGEGQQLWVAEKNNWNGGAFPSGCASGKVCGHYTQMVWRNTKEVGCATASGSGHPYSILVCRYSPPGNYNGQKPY